MARTGQYEEGALLKAGRRLYNTTALALNRSAHRRS
jgi:hypothetical protein